MTPTETLRHEHQIILRVLDAARREADSIRRTGQVRPEALEKIVDFVRNFADRCHHAKEEDLLFAKLRERGMPAQAGPIAVMLHEHDEGRRRIAAVVEALPEARQGAASAIEAVRTNLLAYADLLEAHIAKEDNVLYPMADRLLTAADQQALADAFEQVEANEIGPGVHEKYHKLADELTGA
jgi:hemerythrin-like domain-containing protein